MTQMRLQEATGWPAKNRMQWESYRSYWVMHPDAAERGLRVFLAKARDEGLTQIVPVREGGMLVVIATRPGDPTGKEALV